MDKQRLLKKAKAYLANPYVESDSCCESHFEKWIDAVILFRSISQKECCTKTLRALQHFILEESVSSDYIVRKDAMFGNLNEIRRDGFEKRYQHNVKITKTYIAAYRKTEEEYNQMFGRKRYASYDSFRNVRNRYVKKK